MRPQPGRIALAGESRLQSPPSQHAAAGRGGRDTGMDEFGDAHALLLAGEYASAMAAYDAILAREPQNPVALQNLALCRYQSADLAGALAAIDAMLAVSPGGAAGYHIRGLIKLAQQDIGEAIVAFENAVALNPADAGCFNELGNLYL